MTAARRVLPLSLACLLALALPAAPARAETFTIDGTVNRSNGGNVLDGDDEIIINKGARIEVNRSSTPLITGQPNTGVILRKSDGTNSPNNTVRNNGDIVSTGDFGEGVSVIDGGTSGNRLFNNGNISAVGRRSRGVELGENSRLVNNGTITLTDDSTTRDPATGVLVGSNSIITNNGAIESQDTDGAVVFGSSGSIGGSTLNNNAGGRIIQRALRNGGTSGPAVSFSGNRNTLNNAGLIDQQGNAIAILFSNGNNNTFKNSGTITTSADNGGAAVEFNARSSTGNTIDNLKGGRIITKGNAAHGIRAGSNNKTITNAGAITTEGLSAYGIYIDANNTVVNSGTITTAGNSAFGINASLAGNTVTNSGTITTTGPFASAISVARGNTITNSKGGRITTTGESSHGIVIGASGSGETTITNSGAISVTGRNAHAIATNRGNNTVTNRGTLSSRGGHGIRLVGADNSVSNEGGAITISGDNVEAISARADNNRISNNGALTTRGANSAGIRAGNNTTLTLGVNSRITTTGANSDGIRIDGLSAASATLRQRGSIKASATGMAIAGDIPALINEASPGVEGSGLIQGGTTGVTAPYIGRLDNSGRIIGRTGDGVTLNAASGSASRTATVENNGTIQGQTHGLNYGIHAISNLQNSGVIMGTNESGVTFTGTTTNPVTVTNSGKIQGGAYGLDYSTNAITRLQNTTKASAIRGGRNEALRTVSLATLNNEGTIASNSAAAITLTGTASGRVTITNSGTIQGATYGLNYGRNAIAELQNTTKTSAIRGGRNEALSAASLTTLNNEGTIASTSAAAITLTGTASGRVTITNSGTIQGGTYGLNYGNNAIAELQNTTKTSIIRGGRNEALNAASLTTLNNEGTIASTSAAAITLTGETSQAATVTNSGTIQGQTHGLDYGAHFITRLSNNGGVIRGTNGAGVTFTGTARNPVTITNSGTIQGGTYGLNYGSNAITRLQNTTKTSAIRGGRNDALRTASLTTLNNEGTIASTSAAAITLTGRTTQAATVTNSGTIQGATYGLNYGNNAIASLQNNNGTIQGGTRAALTTGTLANLTNSGTIASTSAAAITLTGNTNQAATITNTGTIRGGTYGLNYGNNPIASLTNTSPRTLRGGSREALSAGSLLTLNNSGTILSDKASAITLTRTATQAATITNSGTIQGNIHGLDYGNNAIASLTNSGTIRGTTGIGVKAAGLATLNNTGTIEGQTGIQIARTGTGQTGATINNAGTLRSLKGSKGTALDLQGPGRDTLNLQAGSTLEGQVRWDGQDDTLNLATGPARLTLIDNNAEPGQAPTPFTIKTNGRPFLLNTTTSTARGQAQTTVTVLDPARIHTRTERTQSQWTGAVFQSLAQQQGTRTGPNARNSTAAVHQTLWVRPFGGLHNFKRDGLTPAARYRYGGALAGYAVSNTDWQAGGFVGAAQDTLAARGPGADAEGRHVFAGAYASTRWQALNLKAGLLFGQSRTETEWQRLNNQVTGGQERVVYEGRRYLISPELGLATRLTVRGVALEPALSLRYLGLFGAEEAERLVAGREPLRFRAEDRHVGLVRASVGVPLRFPVNAYGGQLYGQLRVGAEGRKRFGGERIEARRGDGVVRFKVDDEATVRGFMGAGFEYVVPDLNLSFSADLEASYGSEAVLGVQGQLGVVWGF